MWLRVASAPRIRVSAVRGSSSRLSTAALTASMYTPIAASSVPTGGNMHLGLMSLRRAIGIPPSVLGLGDLLRRPGDVLGRLGDVREQPHRRPERVPLALR